MNNCCDKIAQKRAEARRRYLEDLGALMTLELGRRLLSGWLAADGLGRTLPCSEAAMSRRNHALALLADMTEAHPGHALQVLAMCHGFNAAGVNPAMGGLAPEGEGLHAS